MKKEIVTQHSLVVVHESGGGGHTHYSLEVAAELTGVHPDLLRHYGSLGLLTQARAEAGSEPVFDDAALYEVRLIEHFRRHHGVNLSALPLVWELSKEIDRLRSEIRFLRDR